MMIFFIVKYYKLSWTAVRNAISLLLCIDSFKIKGRSEFIDRSPQFLLNYIYILYSSAMT